MTYLTKSNPADDCELLFSDGKSQKPTHDPSRTSTSTRPIIYGIFTCLVLLVLLLITSIAAPFFLPRTLSGNARSDAELAAEEMIFFELEKMTLELSKETDAVLEEIKEIENLYVTPKVPVTSTDPPNSGLCYLVPNEQRFDCLPEQNDTQAACAARGCCWGAPSLKAARRRGKTSGAPLDVPYCYYSFDQPSYHLADYQETDNGFEGILERSGGAVDVYPSPIKVLQLQVFFETSHRLRVKITDAAQARFEVPLPILPDPPHQSPTHTLYSFKVSRSPFSFQITRKDTGTVFFDTSAGSLAFYDQFIEIASYLPSRYIYGLGEHTDSHFLHSVDWTRFTFWTTDIFPSEVTPLYGDHPFYLNMESDGRANGVFLFNSNAMDVILQPAPAITYRTIGGVLDFYFFLGPSPNDVTRQYMELIGKPALPPYWALGYHLCRWGYESLNGTKRIMERNIAAGVPLDTQWNDIDYMNGSRDFTLQANFTGLADFVADIHKRGMHYIVITDPGISSVEPNGTYAPYDHGVELNCFVKNATGQIIEGRVWTGSSQAYPDFTHPNATAYWTREIGDFRELVPTDGLWIDMNEPSNFVDGSIYGCPNTSLEHPPYCPAIAGPTLATRTLCMTAKHYAGLHYNLHSMYGVYQALTTRAAFTTLNPNKRPFILTRSSFIGQGQFSAHWTGDVESDWSHLQTSIGDILNFNMFGVPLVGADICGFAGDTNPELCLRWHQLAAFYPFARNHNSKGQVDQDPAAFSDPFLKGIKKALHTRYHLLPYFNSLFFRASLSGGTVIRALFFEYPHDPRTYSVDGQFLVGDGLMVSPVVTQGTRDLLVYFPEGRWYDYYTGVELKGTGEWVPMDAPLDHVIVHVRGGSVMTRQQPGQTTTVSRLSPFELVVAVDGEGAARGEMFWDDGEQLNVLEVKGYTYVQFTLKDNTLKSKVMLDGFGGEMPDLQDLSVLGVRKPFFVLVDGQNVTFTYSDMGVLRVPDLTLDFNIGFVVYFGF